MPRLGRWLSSQFNWVRAWRWRRITIALATLLTLIQTPFLGTSRALAYSCDPSHCYGVVDWSGGTSYAGTSILVRGLSAPDSGAGFITNEIWFADSPYYWVETGITIGPVGGQLCTSDCYFWADTRPGAGYYEHFLADVPQTDYGKSTIFGVRNQGGGTFSAEVSGYNGSYYGYSMGNSMSPNLIQTGMELQGSSGGYALQAQYSSNEWADGNFNYYFQTNDGVNGPPGGSNDTTEITWGWGSGQHPGDPNSNGGTWYTQCGC